MSFRSDTLPNETVAPRNVGRRERFAARVVPIGFCLAVLGITSVGGLAYHVIRETAEEEALVVASAVHVATLERLHQRLLDAESTGRAYLVSGDRALLDVYREKLPTIEEELRNVRSASGPSSPDASTVSELDRRVSRRFALLDASIDLRTTRGLDAMLAASIGAGLAEMSAVSAAIKQLKRDENARLSARMDRQKRQVDLLTLGLALAMVIGTLTLAVIFRYMDRLWKARARAEAAATHLAHHDALTGLPNRRLLTDRLNMGIAHARRHGRCVALLCLDLDGFKRVNDTQGHDAGDELLRQVANRLRTVLRGEDTIARTGGDEFVITLGDLDDSSQAQSVAEKIIRAMSIPFTLGDAEATIGTSVGIALYPLHGDTEQALLKSGDAALYRAKAKGKSRYELAGAP